MKSAFHARARAMLAAEAAGGAPVTAAGFAARLTRDSAERLKQLGLAADAPLSHGNAARLMMATLQDISPAKP